MSQGPRRITDNQTLRREYDALAAGDIVVGRVRMLPGEEIFLLDLVDRGVRFVPSALSQLASRSKTLQVRLFQRFMLPHTHAIHDGHALRQAMQAYHAAGLGPVVTKRDRANAGLGIHYWASVEDVFNQAALGVLPYPFVLQPFCGGCRDIRAVMLGDYVEAYWRDNPHNFRNNLHFGGTSTPCTLTTDQEQLCRAVMTRGRFLYAHLDLLVLPDGNGYLAEVNLRGGIRGARITPAEYRSVVEALEQREVERLARKGR